MKNDWDNPLGVVKQTLDTKEEPKEEGKESTEVDMSILPINPEDKRVVNGKTDINQLAPFKYKWAWEFFLNAQKNHWSPLDISMSPDIDDFKHRLTEEEKHLYTNVLAYLTTSDILAMRNIGLAIMEKMSAPELQIYQGTQVNEECLIEGHEVLEKARGWIDIKDVRVGDEVFSFNTTTKKNVFTKVQDKQEYSYTGTLHHFKSASIEQKTTSKHRVPFISEDNVFSIEVASDFPKGKQPVRFITPHVGYGNPDIIACSGKGLTDYRNLLSRDCCTINDSDNKNVFKDEIEVEDTPIYCITVATTVFYVKYNNKVSLTGNSIHTWTYQHCIETLGLDQGEIYNRYRTVPAINNKIQISNRNLHNSLRPGIDLTDREELEAFVMSYMFFAAVFEGTWFYNGFSPIFSLQRRGLMKATGEQFSYIQLDESSHASFGIRVVKQILLEENLTLDPKKISDMWEEAEAAETEYANYLLPEPIIGYNAKDHVEQARYVMNWRARMLNVTEPFPGARNVLPWLDEQANIRKETNFFERTVKEYQTGGVLKWD